MYEGVPSWHELVNYLYKLNYILIDWKGIGSHNTRVPAEADLIFIPNFNNQIGEELIRKNKDKFISLLLIFGHLKLLQILIKRFQFNYVELENLEDFYFN